MNACTRCSAPVRPGRSCPLCGGLPRAGATAVAALLGLIGSQLVACEEMYGAAITDPGWPAPTPPALRVAPDPVDLSGVVVGDAVTVAVAVENTGDAPVELQEVALDPGTAPFSAAPAGGLPAALDPGAALEVAVTFAPTVAGPASAVLRLTSDDPDTPVHEVPVTGVGIP
jgi:hypothetical protein